MSPRVTLLQTAVLTITLLLTAPIGGDAPAIITFKDSGDMMLLDNQNVSVVWTSATTSPAMSISPSIGGPEIVVPRFGFSEIRDINNDLCYRPNETVSSIRSDEWNKWYHSSAYLEDNDGFQVDMLSQVPVPPEGSGDTSMSIATTVFKREVYTDSNQRLRMNEVLLTLTITHWPWRNYDDVLGLSVSVGADILVRGEGPVPSSSGEGAVPVPPDRTVADLVTSNGANVGYLRWSHEVSTRTSGGVMNTLVQVYLARGADDRTDLILVFPESFGSDQVRYSLIFGTIAPSSATPLQEDYTVPLAAGAVMTLLLGTLMFRRRRRPLR